MTATMCWDRCHQSKQCNGFSISPKKGGGFECLIATGTGKARKSAKNAFTVNMPCNQLMEKTKYCDLAAKQLCAEYGEPNAKKCFKPTKPPGSSLKKASRPTGKSEKPAQKTVVEGCKGNAKMMFACKQYFPKGVNSAWATMQPLVATFPIQPRMSIHKECWNKCNYRPDCGMFSVSRKPG